MDSILVETRGAGTGQGLSTLKQSRRWIAQLEDSDRESEQTAPVLVEVDDFTERQCF